MNKNQPDIGMAAWVTICAVVAGAVATLIFGALWIGVCAGCCVVIGGMIGGAE